MRKSWLPGLLFVLFLLRDSTTGTVFNREMAFDVSNKDFPRTPERGAILKTWQKSKFEKQGEEE